MAWNLLTRTTYDIQKKFLDLCNATVLKEAVKSDFFKAEIDRCVFLGAHLSEIENKLHELLPQDLRYNDGTARNFVKSSDETVLQHSGDNLEASNLNDRTLFDLLAYSRLVRKPFLSQFFDFLEYAIRNQLALAEEYNNNLMLLSGELPKVKSADWVGWKATNENYQ